MHSKTPFYLLNREEEALWGSSRPLGAPVVFRVSVSISGSLLLLLFSIIVLLIIGLPHMCCRLESERETHIHNERDRTQEQNEEETHFSISILLSKA